MTQHTFISLILPAYNEVEVIGQTIAGAQAYFRLHGYSYEILVSVDGSDGTRELVLQEARRDPNLRLTGSPKRNGKGHAIRKAVEMAEGQIIGFMDADNKIPIEELGKVIPCFERGYDLVIGSRALGDSKIEAFQPWYRRLGSWGFGQVMHLLAGLHEIPDTQCGFKYFRKEVAHDLFRRQVIDGYMYDVEILYLAQRLGYRLKQVGIRWKDDGDSRLELVRGNFRSAVDLLRLRLFLHRSDLAGAERREKLATQVEDA